MKKLVFNVEKYVRDCKDLNIKPQTLVDDHYKIITVLRHEKNDLYNIRLIDKKNLMSISSDYIEIKEI